MVLEVDNHQQEVVIGLAQEGILTLQVTVDIHQIKERSLADSFLLAGNEQGLLMDVEELLLLGRQLLLGSTTQGVHTPVVEDGGAPVVATESFAVHAALAIFLTSIEHEGVLLHQYRGYHRRHALLTVSSKEVAADALFVVVLQEVEHVVADVIGLLPGTADSRGWRMVTDYTTHRVIHAHLVVQPVKAVQQVATIVIGVIHLTNELDVGIVLTDGLRGKAPELGRHHLRHIATEGIHTLGSPEEQYLRHLVPRVGNGVEVANTTSIVVHAIVQLDSLIPVGLRGCIIEMVITRSLGRLLQVWFLLTLIQVEVRREALAWTIVEVVLRIETLLQVVIGT